MSDSEYYKVNGITQQNLLGVKGLPAWESVDLVIYHTYILVYADLE